MSQPTYPIEPYQPSDDQKEKYLSALRNGHSDELAALMADMTQSQAKDALIAIGEAEVQKARLMSQLPLAMVKERLNDAMLFANDPEAPMALRDALEIAGRRAPEWSAKAQVNVDVKPMVVLPERSGTVQPLEIGKIVGEIAAAGSGDVGN